MSRAPKRKTSAPSSSAAPPVESGRAALKRLADLLGRGFDAPRMEREAAAVMSVWAAALAPEEMRERLDEIREELAAGIEAAEEQGGEIEDGDKAGAAAYQRSLAAIRATHSAFDRAVQRMP
jgi:hypothetical protein